MNFTTFKSISNYLLKSVILVMCIFISAEYANAKKKTVHVIPENATIFLNGAEVGNGSYEIDFKKNMDFVILKFEAHGYVERTVRLYKDNPKNVVSYTLAKDEAFENSTGDEEGINYANKYFSITAKKGMTEDEVWKRLMNIATNNFENVEVRDKSAGWIRTGWSVLKFKNSGQAVRTRLEIKLQFTGDDEISFRAELQSQISDLDCGYSDQCYHDYDRLLRKYTSVISELQTTLGSNL